jgi:Holliday junction DNA helicase RuvA
MIASIQGVVQSKTEDSLVINVSGLGIEVFVPKQIADEKSVGKEALLHTYFHIRENIMALYGFENLEQRRLFLLLLDVNGVGPKASLAVLSTLSMDAVRNAVISEEPAVFSRVPGIGTKTSEKILLQLKDKFKAQPGEVFGIGHLDIDSEVLEALTSLGYSVIEAQSAIQAIPKETSNDVEDRIVMALKYFS